VISVLPAVHYISVYLTLLTDRLSVRFTVKTLMKANVENTCMHAV